MKKRSMMKFSLQSSDMEKARGKSQTVPDESLSIRQIFERYQKGIPTVGKLHTAIDDELPDDADPEDHLDMNQVRNLDLFDKQELAAAVAEDIKLKTEKVDAIKKASASKRAEKQRELDDYIQWSKDLKSKSKGSADDEAKGKE